MVVKVLEVLEVLKGTALRLEHLDYLDFTSRRPGTGTFGPNGAGKSTLMRTIADSALP